ncbi:MAG: DUF1549 domain-containing protein, partial [Blastocatellia bacterium]|nr:DUF1549 domain-containing protein [Blastocatellia bacterium]
MERTRRRALVAILALTGALFYLVLSSGAAADGSQAKPVDFDREIRPILSDNCFACHGPDEKQRMAKLHFDTKEGAFAKQGVIVPGDSAHSKLVMRISSKDPNVVMPPPESGHKLTAEQIELLRRWIDEGAQWHEHWAYVAPKRPEPPQVKDSGWVRNPIDNFILARLEKEGLKPSPEAEKFTLLRRVYLDLTGLPPAPAEVDAFLRDKSPDAYEKVVDKLLASPRYGERMAMQWLDLARYADTHGYHIDSQRDMWPWRDWVINAFNRNMPYDRFTIEQLAGDLLPDATTEQKIASGFNRNHMINFEGGAIPEEYQNEYVVDRVETTSITWLGMTLGCARCHNHKYDPITQKEFYQFYAFFNNVSEKGLDGQRGNAQPFMTLPTPAEKAKKEELEKAIKERADALADKNVDHLQEVWEEIYRGKPAVGRREDLVALYELNGSLSDSSGNYRHGRTVTGEPGFEAGEVSRAVYLDGQTQLSFGKADAFAGDFTFAVWLRPNVGKIPNSLFEIVEDKNTRRGVELAFEQTQLFDIQRWAAPLTVSFISTWPAEAIRVRTHDLFYNGEWKHLAIVYDGSGKASGLKIYLDGKPAAVDVIQDNLNGTLIDRESKAELQIGSKETGRAYSGGIDDLRLYRCSLTP